MRFIFDEWSKYVLVSPPYEEGRKIEKCQIINFDGCSIFLLIDPVLLKEYNLFSQNIESPLSNKNGILHFWNNEYLNSHKTVRKFTRQPWNVLNYF